jgi:putative hydrolase of the HAD superfamily
LIKTVVFDFGNVIGYFDNRRTLHRLLLHTDLTADQLVAAFREANLEDDYEAGRLTTAEFLQRLREIGQLRCPDNVLVEAWSDIFWPNPDVVALLPFLKGCYRLLLGSNTNELHARQFCRQFAEPLRHFDALVLSHKIGVRKPKAGFFEHCQQVSGSAPHECLFIDDLPANIAGAQALGWQGIVYTSADDLHERLAALGILTQGGKMG